MPIRIRHLAKLLALASFGVFYPPSSANAQQDSSRRSAASAQLPLRAERTIDLDTDEGSWISLDVSSDGRTIVFDLLGHLYTIPIAGGTAVALFNDGMAYDAQPRVSPDGKLVVFTSDRDGGDNVWTIDLATKQLKQITKGKNARYRSPAWTPDGQYIVVSRSPQPIGPSKLWMYHKDGGNGIQLIRDAAAGAGVAAVGAPSNISTLGAAFGKDSRYLWYAQRSGAWEYNAASPQYTLYTFDRETGRREQRASAVGSAFRPALSPDGRWLVYGSRYEAQTGLKIRDLQTAEEHWLAYPVQRDEVESVASMDVLPGYAFTPDSRAIVVSYGGKIWRVPVDGSAPANIPFHVQTQVELGPKLAFSYRVDDAPEFTIKQIRDAVPSPDGGRLAFVALDKLYVMDYPGGIPRRLTSESADEAEPAWSPDGQWIAYVSWSRDGGRLMKVRASGGEAVVLTPVRALYQNPAWSPGGDRIAVVRAATQTLLEEGPSEGSSELMWLSANGGTPTFIAALGGGRGGGGGSPQFVARDTGRIYMYNGGSGLVSMRWDGTDERTHLRVTGARPAEPAPGQTGGTPAALIKISPLGDRALAQVANDLYVVPIPLTGEAPTIALANPENAEVPARRLTDVGGQFPEWQGDGRHVHFSIGRSHFVYDLDAGAAGYRPTEQTIDIRAKRDMPEGNVVLRGARIVTMRGDEVIPRGDIVVHNNRIVAVGASAQTPSGARVIDVSGKTIIPGFVDTHAHLHLANGIHQQPAAYLANLAYGVTTTRDPQTGTTDVLTYEDEVLAGTVVGPRVYSTGPGLFGVGYQPGSGEDLKSLDDARRVLKRYSQYYDTKTLKQYIAGNRQQRQWIIMAAKEQQIMPTTEGALDTRYDFTMAIDGYPGQEHAIPVFPIYKDVISLYAQSGITYTPTLIVAYNGPWGENYWYETTNVYGDLKLQRYTPYEELAGKARRRIRGQYGGGNQAGWFMSDEYSFWDQAKAAKQIVDKGGHIGIGSHGQLQGLGYHWELWMVQSGGMTPLQALRCATLFGAQGIGLSQDLGSLEVGKLADLVVLDANPLENIKNSNTVHYVMKNGRLYDGLTLDEVYPRQRKMEPVLGTPAKPKTAAGIK